MELTANKTILRIETWHGLMLAALFVAMWRSKVLDPMAILIGGVFMGLNFLLLGYGVASLITPLASRGRIKTGIGLLVLKIIIFLGVLSTLFFRVNIDPISFAVGFSTLLVAIVFETVRATVKSGI
ncbi:MAG TPA: hypothetical protein VLH17_05745 [Candidatus Binatia bacterium]|nr:hypothetical protein [Candidatus Binatia bacterium]